MHPLLMNAWADVASAAYSFDQRTLPEGDNCDNNYNSNTVRLQHVLLAAVTAESAHSGAWVSCRSSTAGRTAPLQAASPLQHGLCRCPAAEAQQQAQHVLWVHGTATCMVQSVPLCQQADKQSPSDAQQVSNTCSPSYTARHRTPLPNKHCIGHSLYGLQ